MRLPDATGAWGKRPETEAGRIARLASIASDGSASARPVFLRRPSKRPASIAD